MPGCTRSSEAAEAPAIGYFEFKETRFVKSLSPVHLSLSLAHATVISQAIFKTFLRGLLNYSNLSPPPPPPSYTLNPNFKKT